MKPDDPQRWSESMRCIHVWFDGQETTVQVKWELPHEHFTRFGSADVFWWGNRFRSFPKKKKKKPKNVHLMLFCVLNLYLRPAGDFLRDWQQKPELWEKNIALQPAPSRYSRWCKILCHDYLGEPIHRRGGIKSESVDRINARPERWERCYKIMHFSDRVVKCWWRSLWLECFPPSTFSGHYSMSVTMGCLPISTFYFTESTTFLFRLVIFLFSAAGN